MSKRGKYKQYLFYDSVPVPKTTAWRKRNELREEGNRRNADIQAENNVDTEVEEDFDNAIDTYTDADSTNEENDSESDSGEILMDVVMSDNATFSDDTVREGDQSDSETYLDESLMELENPNSNTFSGDTSGSQDIQSENAESCFVNSTPIAGSETSEEGANYEEYQQDDQHLTASLISDPYEEPQEDDEINIDLDIRQSQAGGESVDASLNSDSAKSFAGDAQNILGQPEWLEPLYSGCCMSTLQVILIIASFTASISLTNDGLQSLLSLLTLLLPEDSLLPKTVYLFKKLLPPYEGKTIFFCPKCESTLEDNNLTELVCACSPTPLSKKELMKKGNSYIKLSIEQQLRRLLEEHSLGKLLNDKVFNNHFLSNITDGIRYKTFGNGKLISKYSLSLIMNTDGAPLFKSSKSSLGPVQFFINEIPARMRKKFMIVSCLWAGKVKPSLNSLLKLTVDELTDLSTVGFQWALNATSFVTSTVDLIGASVDSVARAPLQNFQQFNGLFGCSWCEHSGLQMDKEKGGHRVYEYRPTLRKRTHEQVLKHATTAEAEGYAVYGVKGHSVLSKIPFFNIIECILFDSMHCVDLGVTRQLASLWFDSVNHTRPWYMGPELKARLDNRLSFIRAPSNLTRQPRSTEERSFWKASEWRNFLLYYGPQALFGLLPEPFYSHFLLLSEAIYLLNKSKITFNEVCEARTKLNTFVEQFQEIYKIENMSFNVHQLLHACDCVIHWGPLWGFSAYGFEDMNGQLLNMFNGTQAVAVQIAKRFLITQHLKCVTDYICYNMDCDDNLEKFVEIQKQLLGSFTPTKKVVFNEGCALFGKGLKKKCILSGFQFNALKVLLGEAVEFDEYAVFTKKMTYENNLYTTKDYRDECRRQDCFIITKKLKLYQIESIVNITTTEESRILTIIFGYQLKFTSQLSFKDNCQLIKVFKTNTRLDAFTPSDIQSKCIMLRPQPNLIFAVVSNSFDRD